MHIAELPEITNLPLLRDLPVELRERLLKGAYFQRFPSHVELVRQGDTPDFLHILIEGQVEVFSNDRGRETTVAVLGPHESFILAAVILDRVYLKSARTLTAARVLMLNAGDVRGVFALDAGFARTLAAELALAYRGLVKELNNQKLRSGLERLANWLIRQDRASGANGRFEIPFDKKVLAARLGMAPEVLSRALASLSAYGVAVDGRTVALTDPGALNKLARPSQLIDDPEV